MTVHIWARFRVPKLPFPTGQKADNVFLPCFFLSVNCTGQDCTCCKRDHCFREKHKLEAPNQTFYLLKRWSSVCRTPDLLNFSSDQSCKYLLARELAKTGKKTLKKYFYVSSYWQEWFFFSFSQFLYLEQCIKDKFCSFRVLIGPFDTSNLRAFLSKLETI